ncbi:MAG: RHS repeat-associated core domain-containing protein [Geothrix sp.]|nr:RHS repeat-associated core domain-containing protein [Geothrix sp.]
MSVARYTKFLILTALFSGGLAFAQTRFRLADPIAIAQSGGGWNVSPAAGAVTMSLPVATVQGELPIPLVVGMNASHAVQVNHLWQSIRTKVYTDDGRWYWSNEWVDQGQSFLDRPMYATIHFGYITGGATYAGVPESPSYVLEDGRSLRKGDFSAFSNLSSGTFDLAQKFAFSAKDASSVMVDLSGTLGVYTAGPTEFGSWQGTLQAHNPVNYGAAPTQYTVLMDKDRARVYAFVATFNAWVPILWVDRFGHSVTFQWTQTTSGLGSGMSAAHCVVASNQRGKGVKLSWATYLSSVTTEVELVRADFVGVAAPSLYVKGYPGLSTSRPNTMSALTAPSGVISPDVPGPIMRPTQVQIGGPDAVAMPSWGGATPVKPSAPPPSNPTACPTMTWSFGYDGNHASLAGATDALGVQASWVYSTNMFITPGGVGSGRILDPIGTWKASIDDTYLYAARQMDLLDSATNETWRQTWTRTLPDGGAQTQWQTIYKAWFTSKGTPGRSTELNYAPTTSERDYSNGSLMSYRLLAADGSVLATQTNALVPGGVDSTASMLSGTTTIRQGEPDRTVAVTYVDSKNLQVQQQKLYVGTIYVNEPPAGTTAYEWDTHFNLLDFNRPITVTNTRFNLQNGATIAPASVVRTEYDSTMGLPVHVYRDGGATGKDGQALSYDSDGRASFMQVAHDEPGFSGIAPYDLSVGFDPVTGLPQSKTTSYWDPDSTQRSTLVESQTNFDSAGRPQSITNARGLVTTLDFDLRGRVRTKSTAGVGAIIYAFPDEKTTTITQNSRTITERRDGFGRLLSRSNPDGSKTEFTYDIYGRLVSQKEITWNGSGRTSTTGYDDLDRVTSQLSPNSTGISIGYTKESGAYATSNELAVITRSAMGTGISSKEYRDVFGQVVKQIAPTGEITTATYDGSGNQIKVTITPPAGSSIMIPQDRLFNYDGLGRMTSKSEPETGTITFGNFNGLNQPCLINEGVVSNQPTRSRTLLYDGIGRLRRVSGGSDSLSYVYQGADLQSAISSHGSESVVQTYQYWPDAAKGKRLKQESTNTVGISPGFSPTIQYDYDSFGRLNSITYPSLRVVTYDYDQDSRIVGIKNNGQPLVSNVGFDDWGNRSTINFASGASSEWKSKDFGLHLDTWTIKYSTATTLSGPRSYGYDTAERLTLAGEWSITPDASGRVLAANAAALGINTTHSHDAYGNNIYHSATGAGVPPTMNYFSFGPQPTNGVPGGSTGWSINGMGEATQIGLETGSNQGVALGWDGLGRLAAANATPSGVIQSYRYAPSGLRINIIDAAQSANNRRFAYSTGGLLLAEYNDSGWKRDVIYLGSEAIAEIDVTGVYELHNDHLGTPRVITRGSSIVGTQTFGPYGEYISNYSSGYQPLTGYTGHVQTDATRLIYMRGRYYSPSWHRFLNSDQGVDENQLNQRAYVGGSPFMATDPSGMCGRWVQSQSSQVGDGPWVPGIWYWVEESCGGGDSIGPIPGPGQPGGGGGGGQGGPGTTATPQSPQPKKDCPGTGARTPDGYSFSAGFVFGMGGWVNLTVDRYGTSYLGLNGGTGFLGKSLSATAVWLTQSNTPTPQQLESHFSGWSGNVAAGYGLGGALGTSSSSQSFELGGTLPGFTAGGGYSINLTDATKPNPNQNPHSYTYQGQKLERCY